MSDRANLVRVLTASTGTSTMTLGAAYSQLFMTSAEANMVDGRTYTYLIVDGNNWELGKGVYTASGTTLSRVTVLSSRISGTLGTTKITLTGTAQVRITESADDMGALRGTRAVTGTSDTIANNDLGRAITYSNASAIAASLAQAGASSQFLDGWTVHVKNTGAGTLTITPATSTINGGSTLVLAQNMGAFIWSDGTNYHAYFFPVTKPLLAANNLPELGSAATARANLGIAAVGQCVLSKVSTNLVLLPKDGNLLTVNGVQCTIPDSGVSLAPTALTPGTLYYIYGVATAGVVTSIEASSTGYAVSTTAGNKGVVTKSGDQARTLVGMAMPIAGPAWIDSARQIYIASWFNRRIRVAIATTGSDLSTTNSSPTDVVNSSTRPEIIAWNDEVVTYSVVGYLTTSGGGYGAALSINGTRVITAVPSTSGSNGSGVYFQTQASDSVVYEGYQLNSGNGTDTITLKSGAYLSVSATI